MTEVLEKPKNDSTLKLKFYSHATLECKNIAATRAFFAEFLGFETVLMSSASFWARMGGEQVIVVVKSAEPSGDMNFLNHNGLDVATDQEVDQAYELVQRDADKWSIKKITKPTVVHGTYCFYFWDLDGNAWEILSNPKGGYGWGFELGDQKGAGHMSKKFERPTQKSDA